MTLPDSTVFAAVLADPRVYTVIGIAFITGLVRGFSGFGSALIYIPLASAVLGPRLATASFVVMDLITALPFLRAVGPRAVWGEVLPIALTAAIGVQIGTQILRFGDPTSLRWVICVLVALVIIVLITGWRYRNRPKLWLTLAVGLVAGVCGGAAQLSGPPVLIYWLGSIHPPDVLRANFLWYFTLFNVSATITYAWYGLITPQAQAIIVLITPVCMIGMWLGGKMFPYASERTYRRIAYAIVVFSAVAGLPLWDSLR